MTKDKKVLYLTSLISLAVLLTALFTVQKNSRFVVAALMTVMAPIICLIIRKRSARSIAKKDVLLLMTILSVIISVLIEITGIYFGYYYNPYYVSSNILFTFIAPIAVTIVATEITRSVLLSQKNGFADVVSFLIGVAAETLMISGFAGATSFNQFMDLVGMALLPAISGNVLYHYVSKNYGALPNIAYRLISTLYVYFMPNRTAMASSLSAMLKLTLPIGVFALILAMFSKTKKNAVEKGKKLSVVGTAIAITAVVAVAMLISCQFRFGALVIATDSMTGEINKGDMIIYERYDDQNIREGQVIVFFNGEANIVHRVIRKEYVNGEWRYFTKGDFNETEDRGYRTDKDIVGLTDFKLAYAGYPTLWLREIISN